MTTAPVFNTVAARLSFWNRLSKRKLIDADDTPLAVLPPQTPAQEQAALDKIMQGKPAEAIKTIVDSTAPPPVTTEQRHSELEDKVVRECIRQFAKGGMYFSYTFGTMSDNRYIYQTILTITRCHTIVATQTRTARKISETASASCRPWCITFSRHGSFTRRAGTRSEGFCYR